MSEKFLIGNDVVGFEDNGRCRPISRITLMVDNEYAYTAGDDTGLELTATCIHATQAMADELLEKFKGYEYQMFTAEEAGLDPAAELGDGISVCGVYATISRISDDGEGFPDVTGPGESELEDEYPAAGPMTQEIERQLAKTRSLISKSSEEIMLKVEQLDGELGQTLRVAADGVTITNAEGDTLTIDGGQIDASKIKTEELDASKINVDELNLTGQITWADLDSSTQTTVNNASATANAANANANTALANASAASSQVSAWTYPGTTMINGSSLVTGTVKASYLAGGTVQLLANDESVSGYMTMTPASTGAYAVELASYGALRLISSGTSAVFLGAGGSSGGYGFVQCGLDGSAASVLIGGTQLSPAGSGNVSLGASTHLWSSVYAVSGTIQTSDLTHKVEVEELPEKYLAMLDGVTPRRFKLVEGTSGRYHVGFIAQEVEAAMEAAGVSDMEFGGWVKDVDEDGKDLYMLRYEEFIGLLLGKLRQLEKRLEALE